MNIKITKYPKNKHIIIIIFDNSFLTKIKDFLYKTKTIENTITIYNISDHIALFSDKLKMRYANK